MEELLSNILGNSSLPIVTAFVLGLMTAISPCPLATNITAIGFISKDVEDKQKVFVSGLVYTLGRALAYTLVALIIYIGADQFEISGVFQEYGEKLVGPILIVIGIFMLDIIKIKMPGMNNLTEQMGEKGVKNYWSTLLLGVLFALAFCPYSGVLYFGMLIPITVTSASGLYLPAVYAIATGIPVMIFAWLIAYTVGGVGKLYNGIKTFEKWFRKVIAILFIATGIYLIITVFF